MTGPTRTRLADLARQAVMSQAAVPALVDAIHGEPSPDTTAWFSATTSAK